MRPDRRDFLKHVGCLTAATTGAAAATRAMAADAGGGSGASSVPADPMGVLVDLTACIGCRLCEYACKKANDLEPGDLASYDDQSVFNQFRRPEPGALTVVNAFAAPGASPTYVKINCMHCNHCACASACIVGALQKQENGAVTYDAWKCIGCRYCMAACPFQLPAYEYGNAFTPQIVKCQLCYHKRTSQGGLPACVEACPREAMTWGKRGELIALADERIAAEPGKYVDHVYGEHEVGGTSWMYLSPVPFDQIGFPTLGPDAPPALSEKIQRGKFSYGLAPLAWLGALGAMMWFTKRRDARATKPRTFALPVLPNAERLTPSPSTPGEGGGEGELVRLKSLDVQNHPHPHLLPAYREKGSEDHHDHDDVPQPVARQILTPGVWVLIALTLAGMVAYVYRFIFGLAASTNLDQQHPWGLWVGIDVATGVALAAGGFTTAALAYVFGRGRYLPLVRPALLTATLGYTAVVIGLQADLGRYYNVWHPLIPTMWQGNSVLFEVGLCEFGILNLLWLQFAPIICHWLMDRPAKFPGLARWAAPLNRFLERSMFAFILCGLVLATLHQSALGNLLVIAPYKLHPLWWTPISGLLFLVSAVAVGLAMVTWESLFAGWALKLKPEMHALTPLARLATVPLGAYLLLKAGDSLARGTYASLLDGSVQSLSFWVETVGGGVIPLVLLMIPAVRRSPAWLFAAATCVVLGVILNRVNVFLIGYEPPYAARTYFPSLAEWAVTIGLAAGLMLAYRVFVTVFPVISQPRPKKPAGVAAVP
jgi:Ni/Fe-hydrogenase subunit HybB-like protein/Fe-S-cluster-containing dehydrogenase component